MDILDAPAMVEEKNNIIVFPEQRVETPIIIDFPAEKQGEKGNVIFIDGVTQADNWLAGKNGDVNWKSRPNFGHAFETHGAGNKNTKSLIDRARGRNQEQGQWLDNQKVAELLNSNGKVDKVTEIDIPEGLGQVITETGEIIPANRARIVPSPKGKIKTAYPIK